MGLLRMQEGPTCEGVKLVLGRETIENRKQLLIKVKENIVKP